MARPCETVPPPPREVPAPLDPLLTPEETQATPVHTPLAVGPLQRGPPVVAGHLLTHGLGRGRVDLGPIASDPST